MHNQSTEGNSTVVAKLTEAQTILYALIDKLPEAAHRLKLLHVHATLGDALLDACVAAAGIRAVLTQAATFPADIAYAIKITHMLDH
jgi:hypothetical protein